jgi:hypothetical protein
MRVLMKSRPACCRQADALVLRGGLDKSQRDLVPLDGNPQGNNHLFISKRLSIYKEGHQVIGMEQTLLKLP